MSKLFDNSQLGFRRASDLIKANIDQQFERESNYSLTEEELQKARVDHEDLIVLSESGLNEFKSDLQKAFDNVLIDEVTLEKAHKDLGKLIKTTVIDKNGHKRTVYIARKEYKSHTEHHAEIHATIARQKALLANPKSPASAKTRAHEILKVEHAKLEKLGGGKGVFHEQDKSYASNISKKAHDLTNNTKYDASIEQHEKARDLHLEASKANDHVGEKRASGVHNQEAEHHQRMIDEKKRLAKEDIENTSDDGHGTDSSFKPEKDWQPVGSGMTSPDKGMHTAIHGDSVYHHDRTSGKLHMGDLDDPETYTHTYHKPVKTEAEANAIIGRTLDGGAEDHEWEEQGEDTSGEKYRPEDDPDRPKSDFDRAARINGGSKSMEQRRKDFIADNEKSSREEAMEASQSAAKESARLSGSGTKYQHQVAHDLHKKAADLLKNATVGDDEHFKDYKQGMLHHHEYQAKRHANLAEKAPGLGKPKFSKGDAVYVAGTDGSPVRMIVADFSIPINRQFRKTKKGREGEYKYKLKYGGVTKVVSESKILRSAEGGKPKDKSEGKESTEPRKFTKEEQDANHNETLADLQRQLKSAETTAKNQGYGWNKIKKLKEDIEAMGGMRGEKKIVEQGANQKLKADIQSKYTYDGEVHHNDRVGDVGDQAAMHDMFGKKLKEGTHHVFTSKDLANKTASSKEFKELTADLKRIGFDVVAIGSVGKPPYVKRKVLLLKKTSSNSSDKKVDAALDTLQGKKSPSTSYQARLFGHRTARMPIHKKKD